MVPLVASLSEDPLEPFALAVALPFVEVSVVTGIALFPDASTFTFVDDDGVEKNENALPNIPLPEASVVAVDGAGFPDASTFVVDEENNENGSKFGENKSLTLVVPPNND